MTTTTTPRPVRGLTAEAILVQRSLRRSLRDGESLLMAILLPVLLMVMFTQVFGGAIDPGGGYVDYIVPGIILLCAGFGAASTAVYVATDMRTGVIDRIRTLPLRASAVLTGHVVASVLRNLVATAVVIVVALALGFRPTAALGSWLGVVALVTLYILAITYLFAAIGLAAGSPEAASGYGFIVLFVPYLSSAFVPVDTMPGWLQPIAQHQPVTPIIETVRALLDERTAGVDAAWAIGWCRPSWPSPSHGAPCCSGAAAAADSPRTRARRGARGAGPPGARAVETGTRCASFSRVSRFRPRERPRRPRRSGRSAPRAVLALVEGLQHALERVLGRRGGATDEVGRGGRRVGQDRAGADQVLGLVDDERHEPFVHGIQRCGRQAVVAVLTLFAHRDQFRLAQHLEVLRDGRLADAEFRDDVGHARTPAPLTQKLQDVPTSAVGDHVEDVRHGIRLARARGGVP